VVRGGRGWGTEYRTGGSRTDKLQTQHSTDNSFLYGVVAVALVAALGVLLKDPREGSGEAEQWLEGIQGSRPTSLYRGWIDLSELFSHEGLSILIHEDWNLGITSASRLIYLIRSDKTPKLLCYTVGRKAACQVHR
jgi:hypothetical protein